MKKIPWPIRAPETGTFELEDVLARPMRLNWMQGKEATFFALALPDDAQRIGAGSALHDENAVQGKLADILEGFFYGESPVLEIGHPGVIFRLFDGTHAAAIMCPLHVEGETTASGTNYSTHDAEGMAQHFLNQVVGTGGETLADFISKCQMVEAIPVTWLVASQYERFSQKASNAFKLAAMPKEETGFLHVRAMNVCVTGQQTFVDDMFLSPEVPISPRNLSTPNMRFRSAAQAAPGVKA